MGQLNMTEVQSSQIRAVGHNPDSNMLYVEFHNGSIYEYKNVTAELYAQLVGAESVGSFFSKTIKANPTAYPFSKR